MSVAEGNLNVAKAAVVVNQRYEDDTVIKAPFDGVVTVKSAQPGEIVSPQFLGGGGIAKIVDMGSLEVDVDVGESFIHRVRPEQAVQITLNAYPDQVLAGRVIAIIPTADRSKATVKVRIGFDERDPRIVPEMGARVCSVLGRTIGGAGGWLDGSRGGDGSALRRSGSTGSAVPASCSSLTMIACDGKRFGSVRGPPASRRFGRGSRRVIGWRSAI